MTTETTTSEARALQIIASAPQTITELTAEGSFYEWQSERIEAGGWTKDPAKRDRYERCRSVPKGSPDGSTHAEHLMDFRDYGAQVYRLLNKQLNRCKLTSVRLDELQTELELKGDAFVLDCDWCEQWHVTNGSLNKQIGHE